MNAVISVCMYLYLSLFTPQVLGIKDKVVGVFEDWVDCVKTAIKEAVVNMVASTIELMIDLLTNGICATTSNKFSTAVRNLLLYQPEKYMGGTIWKNVTAISEKLIVPTAMTIIAIIAVYDLYQMVVMGNGMHDFDSSTFIRWVVKTDIAITLTSNAFPITSWIFQFGSTLAFNTISVEEWLKAMLGDVETGEALRTALMKYETGELFITFLISVITLAAVFFMLAAIVVGLMGRLIEMYMYLSISPITISTLMNNETKGVGDSWIRGAFGLSFQVFFIIIALTIFGSLFTTTMKGIADGTSIIWNMLLLCAYSITLIITILRSGQISKGMFGAH